MIKDMNMKKSLAMILMLMLAAALFGCGTNKVPSQSDVPGVAAGNAAASGELTIAAAASLTDPLSELITNYAAVKPDLKITPTYGGSGALQTQIEQGAPVDIFLSAAAKQMDALDKAGLIVTSSRVDLLKNEIVLVVPASAPVRIGSFSDISTAAVNKIAIGDPKSVPAGQYAQDTLSFLNLWDTVSAKAVMGSDVKQVLSWVSSGDIDCGIVYKTDAISDKNVQIIAEAPNGSHKPIVYPAAVVKASANQDAAQDFLQYLQSDAATAVFEKYGFLSALK